MQPYKFNSNPATRFSNPKAINIRKINPNNIQLKPVSRGSGVSSAVGAGLLNKPPLDGGRNAMNTIAHGGVGEKHAIGKGLLAGGGDGSGSILSGASTGVNTQVLPDLKKVTGSRSVNRVPSSSNTLDLSD